MMAIRTNKKMARVKEVLQGMVKSLKNWLPTAMVKTIWAKVIVLFPINAHFSEWFNSFSTGTPALFGFTKGSIFEISVFVNKEMQNRQSWGGLQAQSLGGEFEGKDFQLLMAVMGPILSGRSFRAARRAIRKAPLRILVRA